MKKENKINWVFLGIATLVIFIILMTVSKVEAFNPLPTKTITKVLTVSTAGTYDLIASSTISYTLMSVYFQDSSTVEQVITLDNVAVFYNSVVDVFTEILNIPFTGTWRLVKSGNSQTTVVLNYIKTSDLEIQLQSVYNVNLVGNTDNTRNLYYGFTIFFFTFSFIIWFFKKKR